MGLLHAAQHAGQRLSHGAHGEVDLIADLVHLIALGHHVLAQSTGAPQGIGLGVVTAVGAHIVHASLAVVALAAAGDGGYHHLIAGLDAGSHAAAHLLDHAADLMAAVKGILLLAARKVALLKGAQTTGLYLDQYLILPDLRHGKFLKLHGLFCGNDCLFHLYAPPQLYFSSR